MKKKYIIWKSTKNGQWYWRIISSNGKQIACGGEGFLTKAGAKRGMKSNCLANFGDWDKIEKLIEIKK